MKYWLSIGLMTWGGIGVLNQYFLIGATAGTASPTAALSSFDPATILGIAGTAPASYTSPAMLADAAILGAGAYLMWGF
jgi:hypothetical protein